MVLSTKLLSSITTVPLISLISNRWSAPMMLSAKPALSAKCELSIVGSPIVEMTTSPSSTPFLIFPTAATGVEKQPSGENTEYAVAAVRLLVTEAGTMASSALTSINTSPLRRSSIYMPTFVLAAPAILRGCSAACAGKTAADSNMIRNAVIRRPDRRLGRELPERPADV